MMIHNGTAIHKAVIPTSLPGRTKFNLQWGSELLFFWTLSIFQYSKKLKNTTFRKLDVSVLRSGGGGRIPNQLGPLERANLNHWIDSVAETRSFIF
jgi:hypothetical protein